MSNNQQFDIVFIDGNHTGDQVRRDIENSLGCLAPGGVIMLHDMNPPTRFHARGSYKVDGKYPAWNGTSWKGYAWARANRPDLTMYVVDTDWGVGLIHPGRQETIDLHEPTYSDLSKNRGKLLNIISVGDFLNKYSNPFRFDHD
ncbi:class I SAM-dependent methyltransferase [Sulfitobacter aestuariivivens]|uniref:class I SAM-dependent methyltransferase n=1 Tax=Sulfitobacter aestuariivivens TaxID=2766981 RepID=UPI003606318C